MHDQANDLRRLVRDVAAAKAPAAGRRPSLVVVASGKGGVGTTTIAVNLAVVMARDQYRTILVDADPRGGDTTLLCGIEERYTLADVLAGRRTVAEVLQPGPGDVQVLPGVWGLERLSDYPSAAYDHLVGQLESLGNRADLVVVDAGNGPAGALQSLWQAADMIVVVTTPETPSILDSYASIKALAGSEQAGAIHSLVNQAPNSEVADEVHARLAQACLRFLGVNLGKAGHVLADPMVAAAGRAGDPFTVAASRCEAAEYLDRLAKAVAAALATARNYRRPPGGGLNEPQRMSA